MATAPDAIGRPDWRFRPMAAADVVDVLSLEQACYRFPWSEQVFRDCMRVGYDCWVVDAGDVISGYGVMSMGAGECHILNLCVDPALRRRGIGRALLVALLDRARRAGMEQAFLEVRPSNAGALALYRRLGFEPIGLRRGYYQAEGGREDAIVLRFELARLPGG